MIEGENQSKMSPLATCQNKANRVSLKHKRKKNLIKKAIELNKCLEMDVFILMRDRDTGKFSQYASCNDQEGQFTLERATRLMEMSTALGKSVVKEFTDGDY